MCILDQSAVHGLQQNAPGSAARLRKLSAPLESDGPQGQKEPGPTYFPVCAQKMKFSTFARRQESLCYQATFDLEGRLIPMVQSVF